MKKQPLLILLICFIIGILCQEYLIMSQIVICCLLVISGIFLFSIIIRTTFFQRVKHYCIGFFFLSVGAFVHYKNFPNQEIPTMKTKENIVFQLCKKLNSNEKNRRYIVEILDVPSKEIRNIVPVKTVISIPKDNELLDFNHFYDAEVYIHQPENISNDYQFDYKKYLARQYVYFQSYLPNGFQKTEKTTISFADRIRQKRLEILNRINKTSLSPKIQEFLKGIILSDRTEMDAEMVNDFNRTGLVHLLAISGSHMVIIFWITLFVFNQIMPVKFRKLSIVLSLLLIWTFAVFIDYGSSVMRSCLMISCYYIMILLQRKPDLLHSAALSAFLLLIVDSQQVFDVGFQLSYVAVLGIWWLANPIKNLFRKPRFAAEKFFYEITAMTFAAQIATLPLSIFYFHQFSLISVFANLIIIPLSELIIISSLFIVITIAFGTEYHFVYDIFNTFIVNILKLIHWFSGFEGLMNKSLSLTLPELSVLFMVIYLLRFLLKDILNLKYLIRFAFGLLLFFTLRIAFDVYSFRKKEVLVHRFYQDKIISVKDKDQIVFWMKNNKNSKNVRDFIINPYLISRRIKDCKINYYADDSEAFLYEGVSYSLK